MPPIASSAERRITNPVPQQNAAPHASRDGMITSKKQALIVGATVVKTKIGLHRVFIEEILRRLNTGDRRIAEKADQAPQRVTAYGKISVEHHDEIARGTRQRGVDIAGFGVRIVRAGEIPGTLGFGEFGHPRPALVVEHPDSEVWVVEG
jgi:hypothetical protein